MIQSIKEVAKRFHLGWDSVKQIDKAYLNKELNPPDFTGVKCIAVDEISIRRRHRYATIVADAERHRVLWVAKGRKRESLAEFYEILGVEGCRQIKAVAMDMWQPYEEATHEYCRQAEIVYDPFHIIQNYAKVIDEVRIAEVRIARDRQILKGTKYLLLANRENVGREDYVRLKELLKINRHLNTVYVLKDDLKRLWKYSYEWSAQKWFKGWYRRAIYSKIEPLKKFARTLKAHIEGILAHCRHRIGTSFLEGMNNKVKVIKRVAFGFRDLDYFFLKIRGAFL